MAKIPEHFAQQRMETSRLPRAPAGIADVGAGIEAEAMAGMGEALGGVSDILAKWYEREGNSQFDTQRRLVREEINKFELTEFVDADRHDAGYKKLRSGIKKLAPKNKMGAQKFQSWLDYVSPALDRSADEQKIRMISRNNAVAYFKNIATIANEPDFVKARTEALILTQGAVDDKTRTPAQAVSDYEKVMDDWLGADMWRRATTIVRPDGEVDWAQAVKWFAKAENIKGVPSDIIDGLLENAKTQATLQQKRDAGKIALAKTQTATKMLVDLWDNKLVDPQVITDALRDGLVSDTNAKYLREALLNPEPPKTDLKAYAEVKKAITDLGKGALTEDQTLDVIYKNIDKLDPTTGKSLTDKVFVKQDKHDADMQKEGRDLMEELIRDKDPVSGMFTDDERQILGTAEALVELDASIENAARLKKPLKGKDLLIEAIRIGRKVKRELSKEEVPPFRYEKEKRVITDEEVEAALKVGKRWIPDDTRYYIEPPPLRDKIPVWMQLPKKIRKGLWEMYERGEGVHFDYTKEGDKITSMTVTNPTTGKRIISTNGGKTWRELP